MPATTLIALGVLLLILIPIVRSDLRERRIPNALNALLAIAGLALQCFTAPSFSAVLIGLIAPVAVIGLFLGVIALMKLLRRPGTLGLGDVKFLAAASLWVGFIGSTAVFVVASLLSLMFVLIRMPWRKVDLRSAIPFAPFLAAGLVLIYISGAPLHEDAVISSPAPATSSPD